MSDKVFTVLCIWSKRPESLLSTLPLELIEYICRLVYRHDVFIPNPMFLYHEDEAQGPHTPLRLITQRVVKRNK